MIPRIIPLPLFLCLILATSAATFAAPPEARLPEKHRAFFKAHCFDCKDSETQEGKVDLETLPFRITTIEQAELWQKVLGALNSGEMPPKDSEQPGNKEKADFLDDLSLTMVTARKVLSDSVAKINRMPEAFVCHMRYVGIALVICEDDDDVRFLFRQGECGHSD